MSRPIPCVVCRRALDPTERGRLVTGDNITTGYACLDGCEPAPTERPTDALLAAFLRGQATALRNQAEECETIAHALEQAGATGRAA